MAHKIEGYNDDLLMSEDSTDEYEEYTVVDAVWHRDGTDNEGWAWPDQRVDLALYVHEPSGIVLTDPKRFERWLAERRL